MAVPTGAVQASTYLHWGVIQISLTNLLVILVMVLVFVAALLLPFPGGHEPVDRTGERTRPQHRDGERGDDRVHD